jgi:hypothetical protein
MRVLSTLAGSGAHTGLPHPVISCTLPEYSEQQIWFLIQQYLKANFPNTAGVFAMELGQQGKALEVSLSDIAKVTKAPLLCLCFSEDGVLTILDYLQDDLDNHIPCLATCLIMGQQTVHLSTSRAALASPRSRHPAGQNVIGYFEFPLSKTMAQTRSIYLCYMLFRGGHICGSKHPRRADLGPMFARYTGGTGNDDLRCRGASNHERMAPSQTLQRDRARNLPSPSGPATEQQQQHRSSRVIGERQQAGSSRSTKGEPLSMSRRDRDRDRSRDRKKQKLDTAGNGNYLAPVSAGKVAGTATYVMELDGNEALPGEAPSHTVLGEAPSILCSWSQALGS